MSRDTAPSPLKALTLGDEDLWNHLTARGVSPDEATRHVLLRRQATIGNLPENIMKDLDPGALASFGLGAADMMSFGLGDQVARALEGNEATITQQAAGQLHPGAHLAGEVAGALAPFGLERGLAAAGVEVAPTAIGAAVRSIKSLPARALARTAINATVGAGYAGAQAAGHTEGGWEPRWDAAKRALVPGAVLGAALPWVAAGLGAAGSTVLRGVAQRVAGPEATATVAAERLAEGATAEELAVAKQLGIPVEQVRGRVGTNAFRGRATTLPIEGEVAATMPERAPSISPGPPGSGVATQLSQRPLLPTLRATVDPLETVPTYVRRGNPEGIPYTPKGPGTIGDDPVAQLLARQQVERDVLAGARGPRGGARYSTRQMPPQGSPTLQETAELAGRTTDEITRLAQALRDLPTPQLQLQAESPLVEDWIRAAAQKELTERLAAAQ